MAIKLLTRMKIPKCNVKGCKAKSTVHIGLRRMAWKMVTQTNYSIRQEAVQQLGQDSYYCELHGEAEIGKIEGNPRGEVN